MSGPQFFHLQTFSRKSNPAGQSVDQILGEVERDPEFSQHVDAPEIPTILYGVSIPELRAAHDAMVDGAGVEVQRKGQTYTRAIRKDRHTLCTAVASYPLTWDQIRDNPEEMARLEEWKRLNVEHLQRIFGDRLKTVIEHTDEAHPHIHGYALPEGIEGIDATLLHIGKAAKKKAEAEAKEHGEENRAAVKAGNRALKDAMRAVQDDYFQHVGGPSGLTRDGPKRGRKSRADWKAEKEAARRASLYDRAQIAAEIEKRQRALDAKAARLDQRDLAQDKHDEKLDAREKRLNAQALAQDKHDEKLDEKTQSFDVREAALKSKETALEARESKLKERENLAERLIRQATELLDTVADQLGVRRGVDALREALASMIEPRDADDPFSAPEEPREETDGPGF